MQGCLCAPSTFSEDEGMLAYRQSIKIPEKQPKGQNIWELNNHFLMTPTGADRTNEQPTIQKEKDTHVWKA